MHRLVIRYTFSDGYYCLEIDTAGVSSISRILVFCFCFVFFPPCHKRACQESQPFEAAISFQLRPFEPLPSSILRAPLYVDRCIPKLPGEKCIKTQHQHPIPVSAKIASIRTELPVPSPANTSQALQAQTPHHSHTTHPIHRAAERNSKKGQERKYMNYCASAVENTVLWYRKIVVVLSVMRDDDIMSGLIWRGIGMCRGSWVVDEIRCWFGKIRFLYSLHS